MALPAEVLSENASENSACHSKQNLVKNSHTGSFEKTAAKRYMQPHIIVLLILVCGLSTAVAYLSYLYVSEHSKQPCQSLQCVRSAANLLASMNEDVDPCDDFYRYACDYWRYEHPIPEHSYSTDWFSDRTEFLLHSIREFLIQNDSETEPFPVHQARALFRSCLDEASASLVGIHPILEVLNDTNLPLLPPISSKSPNFNWVKTAVYSKNTFDQDFFVAFGITTDPKNRSMNRLYIGKPSGESPLPVHRFLEKLFKIRVRDLQEEHKEETAVDEEQEDSDDFTEEDAQEEALYATAYVSYIVSVMEKIHNYQGEQFKYKYNFPKGVIPNLVNFTISVDKLVTSTYSNSDSLEPDYILLRDLQNITDTISSEANVSPIINWEEYFTLLFENVNVTLDFNDTESLILISNLDYVKDVFHVLVAADLHTVELYMWWSVVSTLLPYSTHELREMSTNFIYSLTGHRGRESRTMHCSDIVNEVMGMAVSYSLIDDFSLNTTKHEVAEMVDDIHWAFRQIVQKLDWMDQKTKEATQKKSKAMKTFIGYPSLLLDREMLEDYYEGLEIREGEFLFSILNEVQRINMLSLESLREPYDYEGDNWASEPTDVNAFHWSQANAITIPAGILRFPFYGHGVQALNYGAIGSIVGHEVTHGFDNSGKEFDHEGNKHLWWTNDTSNEFKEKTKCFIDHYSGYYFPELDTANKLDGMLTLDENLADNGGLREALIGYRRYVSRNGVEPLLPGLEKFTHEQLLFLSFANTWCENRSPKALEFSLRDTHSPNEVRVKAVLSNSYEFAHAWKCEKGTPMNPATKKCQIW